MINSMAMCGDVTLGAYAVESLILVYKSVFIPTLLYGCQVWTRLTKNEESKLKTIQLQFLKRILHVPRSTCNCLVYLELGVLPIVAVIHSRKLNFLHHILALEPEDPVRRMYEEQLTYEAEKNWANECQELMERYGIEKNEGKIKRMSKVAWKKHVKEVIRKEWLGELNEEKNSMKKMAEMDRYERLMCQEYLLKMRSGHARLLFRVRGQITTIKDHRRYEFSEGDMLCRLCKKEAETFEHVGSRCSLVRSPAVHAGDEYSEDLAILESVAARVKEFLEKVDELKTVSMV